MNTAGWVRTIDHLHDQGMRVFTPVQLALVSRVTLGVTRKQVGRLAAAGLLVRLARGFYARPGRATLDDLLPALDPCAYFSAATVLNREGVMDQNPAAHFAVTDRQHARFPIRQTAFGPVRFHTIAKRLHRMPAEGVYAPLVQAVCDQVHFDRRRGLGDGTVSRFRNLPCDHTELRTCARSYPPKVGETIELLCRRFPAPAPT